MSTSSDPPRPWKSHKAALCITMDNMGEAADIQRDLWPQDKPIGHHFSVKEVLPKMLQLLQKYDMPATYFIESWNLDKYEPTIADLAGSGVEIGWHAWQHEPWAKLKDEAEERENFQRSWDTMDRFASAASRIGHAKIQRYRGFRPPSGIVHGQRTIDLCREYGLTYLSPAGERAAVVSTKVPEKPLVVLPFKWRTVDAYYYMDSFGPLRKLKGEATSDPLSPSTLADRYIAEIDKTIEEGGYLSVLFHPFLSAESERLEAMERVLRHAAMRRDEKSLWIARNDEIADWILGSRSGDTVTDPELDTTQWR